MLIVLYAMATLFNGDTLASIHLTNVQPKVSLLHEHQSMLHHYMYLTYGHPFHWKAPFIWSVSQLATKPVPKSQHARLSECRVAQNYSKKVL